MERDTKVIKKHFQKDFASLFVKFSDMMTADQLQMAIKKSEQVKTLAESNLRKIVNQNQDLMVLDKKTTVLQEQAMMFEKRTAEVKDVMAWRNWKTTIYIGLTGVGIGALWYFGII